MRKILDICKQRDIFCLIDETYVEFSSDINKITSVSLTKYYNNLIVIRGISKFFAAPGLRLGYGICGNKNLLKEINSRKNPWTINSLAAIAGEIMFTDTNINDTRHLLKTKDKDIKSLASLKLKVYPPTTNFILIRILKHGRFSTEVLIRPLKGFLIRDCLSFPLDDKFVRFALWIPKQY